jgi:hypothetical protein
LSLWRKVHKWKEHQEHSRCQPSRSHGCAWMWMNLNGKVPAIKWPCNQHLWCVSRLWMEWLLKLDWGTISTINMEAQKQEQNEV